MVTARLNRANNPPVFADATATREVPENSAADTAVGAPVTADDADTGDTLEYTLGGTDASSFDIDSGTGQIKTVSSGTYNYEAAQNSYSVTVTASDGTDTDSIGVTINLTDVDEQPDKPTKPTVTAVSGSSTSLDVSWTEPGLNGGPEITGYQLRYRSRASAPDAWSRSVEWPHTGTTTTTTITGLTANTTGEVAALNGETPSAWSTRDVVHQRGDAHQPGRPTNFMATTRRWRLPGDPPASGSGVASRLPVQDGRELRQRGRRQRPRRDQRGFRRWASSTTRPTPSSSAR